MFLWNMRNDPSIIPSYLEHCMDFGVVRVGYFFHGKSLATDFSLSRGSLWLKQSGPEINGLLSFGNGGQYKGGLTDT